MMKTEIIPLMVDASGAARLIAVSKATWARMQSAGKVPSPVRLSGGCVRWRLADLEAWCLAGCPSREEWEQLQEDIKK